MRLTIETPNGERCTAAVEAWLVAVIKAMPADQARKVFDEVERIDADATRLKLPLHQVISGVGGIRIPTIPAPRPIAGRG